MIEVLKTCENHSKNNNYKFNVAKCETIESKKGDHELTIYGEKLKRCQNFTYLGTVINENGIDWKKHWERLKMKRDKVMIMV